MGWCRTLRQAGSLLCFLIGALPVISDPFRNACAAHLVEQPFLQIYPWALRLNRRLIYPNLRHLQALRWKWNSQAALNTIARRFNYSNASNVPIGLKIELYRDPEVKGPHVKILLTFFPKSNRSRLIGEGAFLIRRNARRHFEAELDSFYIDNNAPHVAGISSVARAFIEREFYIPLGVTRETVFTDYIGRYVWAKADYRFNPSAFFWPERYRSPGGTVKQPMLIQCNLERFLEDHGLSLKDLVVRRPGLAERRLERLADLAEPADFAYLFHRRGTTIRLAPLIAEDTLGEPSDMPIGKAFLLSDYRPAEGGPQIFSMMGTPFSDRAMPKWRGIRDIPSH